MKVGTKSLLFGVHQFIIHPIMVYKAWVYLYGKPTKKEVLCIIIHDWGYFGKDNIDGTSGAKHPETASKIALKLLGEKYAELCLYHSRFYANAAGKEPSRLCWADKLSIAMEPKWFYLFRASLSREIIEYRQNSASAGYISLSESNSTWYDWISELLTSIGKAQNDKFYDTNG